MSYRFGSFFAALFSVAAFAFGVFWFVSPLFPSADDPAETPPAEEEIVTNGETHDINAYVNEFAVDITPPAEGSERAQVGITNIGANTYSWVLLDVSFVGDDGAIKKTVQSGAHSQIRPDDTVNVYVAAGDIENTRGFVSRVQADRFTNDPEMGLVSNY